LERRLPAAAAFLEGSPKGAAQVLLTYLLLAAALAAAAFLAWLALR
jgi:hypothetical protein